MEKFSEIAENLLCMVIIIIVVGMLFLGLYKMATIDFHDNSKNITSSEKCNANESNKGETVTATIMIIFAIVTIFLIKKSLNLKIGFDFNWITKYITNKSNNSFDNYFRHKSKSLYYKQKYEDSEKERMESKKQAKEDIEEILKG